MLAALATAAVAGASECADAYDENCLTSRCCQDEEQLPHTDGPFGVRLADFGNALMNDLR